MENVTVMQLISEPNLDSEYNHTAWFSSKALQDNWFTNKIIPNGTLPDVSYQRKDGNFKIDRTLYELRNANYCIIYNSPYEKYYYFIIDKIYISDDVTELILQLDVIQTYMFDFTFGDSLVEREHTRRWSSNGDAIKIYTEENLDTGEYTIKNKATVYDYTNKGTYFITSSDRLGVSDDSRPGTPSGAPDRNGGQLQERISKPNRFYFYKS